GWGAGGRRGGTGAGRGGRSIDGKVREPCRWCTTTATCWRRCCGDTGEAIRGSSSRSIRPNRCRSERRGDGCPGADTATWRVPLSRKSYREPAEFRVVDPMCTLSIDDRRDIRNLDDTHRLLRRSALSRVPGDGGGSGFHRDAGRRLVLSGHFLWPGPELRKRARWLWRQRALWHLRLRPDLRRRWHAQCLRSGELHA